MNKLFILMIISTSLFANAQVGINTQTPKASFDVVGKPTAVDVADGVMAPRLLLSELVAKTAYGTDQDWGYSICYDR